MKRIVVGIDGSEESRAAFHWALAEAETHDAHLVVVTAWSHVGFPAYVGVVSAPYLVRDYADAREHAVELLLSEADEVAGAERATHLELHAEEGSAAEALIEASKDADLLVVGSRGHGGFAGLLLGSVGQQCAHHAHCPVVIVRNGRKSLASDVEPALD
jgi:nucleotide-binding universal stress UspA family protein